jgi:murein DD-endopeptidase MepM/ murein hydrolase activator NlpD
MRGTRRTATAVVAAGGLAILSSGLVFAASLDSIGGRTPPAPSATGPGSQPCTGDPGIPADGPTGQVVCEVTTVLGGLPGTQALRNIVPPPPAAPPIAPPLDGRMPAPQRPTVLSVPPAPPSQLSLDASTSYPNAPFLRSLLDILSHRLGDPRSDLHHFRSPTTDSQTPGDVLAAQVPTSQVRRGAAGVVITWQVLVPASLIVLLVAVLSCRTRRKEGSPSPATAPARRSIPFALTLVLGGAAAGVGLASSGSTLVADLVHDMAAVHAMPAGSSVRVPLPPIPAPSGHRSDHAAPGTLPWSRLVALEDRLAVDQDRLATLEAQLRYILGPDAEPVGQNRTLVSASRTARLVTAHDAMAADYRDCLGHEYALYRSAGQDPQQRQALLAGAAAEGGTATQAVTYNLQIIDTQLAQERAIADAEAAVARYGPLSAEQLEAIARHELFIAPESAPLTQGFGPTDFWMEPPITYRGTFHPHFHTGIDLAAPLGTPLHAAADGVVLLAAASVDGAGHFVGYGNYVLIGHGDGFATLYGHLDTILVKAGDAVHQGQVIGLEGSTGWSTGPHVHFEIRHGQELLDPLPLVGTTSTWAS